MQSSIQTAPSSRKMLWAGGIISVPLIDNLPLEQLSPSPKAQRQATQSWISLVWGLIANTLCQQAPAWQGC